jgi:hypothetical protein
MASNSAGSSQAVPPNEVREVNVTIREKAIEAPGTVVAGTVTFSFANATTTEKTAAIEGKGGPWKLGRSIPQNRSMTLEVSLEPGDYVIVSGEGGTRLTAKFRAMKP